MNRLPRIGILESGASYHTFALEDPRIASFFARQIYLPTLCAADLADLDALVIADRLHPGLLRRQAATLLAFANQGRTLVVLGEVEAHTWLPGVHWEARPTNFWWWLEGDDPGVRQRSPEHPMWQFVTLPDVTWHYHGFFRPPADSTPLVALEEDGHEVGQLLYEDRLSAGGRLVVTTLDPIYHHGSNFMPAATRFLENLLRWLQWELDRER